MYIIGFGQGQLQYLNRSHSRRQYKSSIITVNHHHYTYCSCGKTPGILMYKSFLLQMEYKRINKARTRVFNAPLTRRKRPVRFLQRKQNHTKRNSNQNRAVLYSVTSGKRRAKGLGFFSICFTISSRSSLYRGSLTRGSTVHHCTPGRTKVQLTCIVGSGSSNTISNILEKFCPRW